MLAIAPYSGVPYGLHLVWLWLLCCLIALLFTALGLLFAVTIRSLETFQTVVSLAMMPLIFLSGAMFPPGTLGGWLGFVVRANPVTYIVDAMRRVLPGLPYGNEPTAAPAIFGWYPPVWFEVAGLFLLAFGMLAFATIRFERQE